MEKFKQETELAKVIIQYLRKMGWEVYQEVQISSFGNIADIIATQNNLVWVLECKLSLSLTLMAQAKEWLPYAHYVSIVTPSKRGSKGACIAKDILKHYGIGHYEIQPVGWNKELSIYQRVSPKLNRKAMVNYIKKYLTEKQKTWAEAGNSKGLRYTPFQDTKDQIIRFVKKNPGITIKELINGINHHYSSDGTARSSILQWIHRGIINEVELKTDGRKYLVYPRGE